MEMVKPTKRLRAARDSRPGIIPPDAASRDLLVHTWPRPSGHRYWSKLVIAKESNQLPANAQEATSLEDVPKDREILWHQLKAELAKLIILPEPHSNLEKQPPPSPQTDIDNEVEPASEPPLRSKLRRPKGQPRN
jgi:hypothetical protein